MFFLSFILVLYLTRECRPPARPYRLPGEDAGRRRRLVAFFAIVEARTGFNVFNHLNRFIPLLTPAEGEPARVPEVRRSEAAGLRVGAASDRAQCGVRDAHPARRLPRAALPATSLDGGRDPAVAGCCATVSRTGILMLVVVVPRVPLAAPARDAPPLAGDLPRARRHPLRAARERSARSSSRSSRRRIVAEQQSSAGQSGSGRLADIGPALREVEAPAAVRRRLTGRASSTRGRARPPSTSRPRTSSTTSGSAPCSRPGRSAFARLALVLHPGRSEVRPEAKRDDSERGWLLVSLAAGDHRVRSRHAHLRRVLVHPGDVPALHLRGHRCSAAGRAPDAPRRTGAHAPGGRARLVPSNPASIGVQTLPAPAPRRFRQTARCTDRGIGPNPGTAVRSPANGQSLDRR